MTDRHDCVWTPAGCPGSLEDGQQVPTKTEAPDSLCPACWKTVERAVNEIPQTWGSLHAAIGNKGLGMGQRVSGSRSLPIGINADVDRLKVALVDWLTAAGARVAEALNLDDDPHPISNTDAEHARIVSATCKLLAPHLDKLISSEADAVMVWRQKRAWDNDHEEWWEKDALVPEDMTGIEIADQIVRANRWGRRMLDPGDRQTFPCPLCHKREVFRLVYWTSGGKHRDLVECQSCGKSWEHANYQAICNVALRAIEEEREVAENEELRKRVQELEGEREDAKVKVAEYGRRIARVRRLTEIAPEELTVDVVMRLLREDVLGEAA